MEKGVSLYLSIIIMTILLAIGFGVSSIFLGQVDIMRDLGYSVIAFYAADAGIERILLDRVDPFFSPALLCTEITPCPLSNGATYYIDVLSGGVPPCPASYNYCIKSIGSYEGTNRAIEITY